MWKLLVILAVIKLYAQIDIFLDLWPIKNEPCRPLPGEQKLHFRQAAFCKNYNIFRTLGQIKL